MSGLRVERSGAIATIHIENEGKRNAVTSEMWLGFGPILDDLASDDAVKVVVFRGLGDDFSAGADIGDLQQILVPAEPEGGHVSAGEQAIASFPKPTVAAIDGYCVGGGLEIALACDIRISSDRATFGITPARLGIIYPLSGMRRLVAIAGPAVAKFLLFSGELVSAADASRFGLVSRVVPAEHLWNEVDRFASQLATRSQLTIRASKQIVDAIAAGDDGSDANELWHRELAGSDEAQRGIEAFLAKREPGFGWTGPTAD